MVGLIDPADNVPGILVRGVGLGADGGTVVRVEVGNEWSSSITKVKQMNGRKV